MPIFRVCQTLAVLGYRILSLHGISQPPPVLQEHERRLKKALARAAAPVFRKVGKPVMFRSAAVRNARQVATDLRDDDEMELEMFLAREML